MRVIQLDAFSHISGGINVESAAKWGGRIGAPLGTLGGASFGCLTALVGVNPFIATPLGGFAGFIAGMYGGYLAGGASAIAYNVVSTVLINSVNYIYSD
ncbi:MAG: hypothetical protein JSS07_12345 [Proteobacteria bacterium]|nr:hypothetical protein [Pseudomonadota bacterium]